MRGAHPTIRYHLTAIFAAHWWGFVATYSMWIRPVVFESVRKALACRTPVLGCHVYRCKPCDQTRIVPHSCKSRFCPACGKHATDIWASSILNGLLDVPYHHLVMALPKSLRGLLAMNRTRGLNLLAQAATEAVQQWARDTMGMRMGIIAVIHTFGADMKWHPHVHLIVTGGGLSLDGKVWIATDPRFLMPHAGLKKRWKYHVISRLRKEHRKKPWRFRAEAGFLKDYPRFSAWLSTLWNMTWYAYIGASLADPRFSVAYIGRYTKRAVLAEYRITYYDAKSVRFSYKDYADGSRVRYKRLSVFAFIGRVIRHIPDKHFPMIRHAGLFSNRWKGRYLAQAHAALRHPAPADPPPSAPTWADRQEALTGSPPLRCPTCGNPMRYEGLLFGKWKTVEETFIRAGDPRRICPALLKPG